MVVVLVAKISVQQHPEQVVVAAVVASVSTHHFQMVVAVEAEVEPKEATVQVVVTYSVAVAKVEPVLKLDQAKEVVAVEAVPEVVVEVVVPVKLLEVKALEEMYYHLLWEAVLVKEVPLEKVMVVVAVAAVVAMKSPLQHLRKKSHFQKEKKSMN